MPVLKSLGGHTSVAENSGGYPRHNLQANTNMWSTNTPKATPWLTARRMVYASFAYYALYVAKKKGLDTLPSCRCRIRSLPSLMVGAALITVVFERVVETHRCSRTSLVGRGMTRHNKYPFFWPLD